MKGFKNSTRTKYECGGRVAKQAGGAVAAPMAKQPVAKQPVAKQPVAKQPVTGLSRAAAASGRTMPVKKAAGGAIARANRSQAEEAREGQKLMREVPARPTRGNNPRYTDEPAEARNARAAARTERAADRTARTEARTARTEARTARREAPRGPAGAGFRVSPMVEVNTGASPSGMRVLRGLEGVTRAVLPERAERALEGRGMLPRRPRS
jgi:hypothetical protein